MTICVGFQIGDLGVGARGELIENWADMEARGRTNGWLGMGRCQSWRTKMMWEQN